MATNFKDFYKERLAKEPQIKKSDFRTLVEEKKYSF